MPLGALNLVLQHQSFALCFLLEMVTPQTLVKCVSQHLIELVLLSHHQRFNLLQFASKRCDPREYYLSCEEDWKKVVAIEKSNATHF